MNKKSVYLLNIFVFVFIILVIEIFFLYETKFTKEGIHKKVAFVELTKLPDLCISTEATFVRHRSLTTVSSIYKDDPSLREYAPSTYAISISRINKQKSNYEK